MIVLPVGDAGHEHIGGDSDDGADRPLAADHVGNILMRHAVLETDQPIRRQTWLDQLAYWLPFGVVGFYHEEHDIEGVP